MAYNPTEGMSPEAKDAYHTGFRKGLYEGFPNADNFNELLDEANARADRAWNEGWDAGYEDFISECECAVDRAAQDKHNSLDDVRLLVAQNLG